MNDKIKVTLTTGTVNTTYTAVVPDDNDSFGPELDKAVEEMNVEISDSSVIFVVEQAPLKLFAKLWLDNPGTCKAEDMDGKVIAHFKYQKAELDGHLIVLQGIG